MSSDQDVREPTEQHEHDTGGHGLLGTDFYIQRKVGRDADVERAARERPQAKETRPNRPERG